MVIEHDSVDAACLRSLNEPGALLLSDTSADPEDRVAEWVIQGYEVRINPEAVGLGMVAFVAVASRRPGCEWCRCDA